MGAQAMKKEPRRLIFHIGQHKTGSKALQSFLHTNAGILRKRGYFYPVTKGPTLGVRAYEISHHRIFALLRAESMEACGDIEGARRWRKNFTGYIRADESVSTMLTSWLGMSEKPAAALLISAEDCFDMHTAHEEGFSLEIVRAASSIISSELKRLGGIAELAVYLRRQDHLLGAHYVQYIKGSNRNFCEFEEFSAMFAPRLASRSILSCWAGSFESEQIHVQAYEPHKMESGIIQNFFCNILGMEVPEGAKLPERNPETVNTSPSRDYVELIRIMNQRNNAGLPTVDKTQLLTLALEEQTGRNNFQGIGAWLSPKERNTLLKIYQADNESIAREFCKSAPEQLFCEDSIDESKLWTAYPGLTPERSVDILLKMKRSGRSGILDLFKN
jgi:hypothetical protein